MHFVHESIFISSLRTFAKTLFCILGIAIGLFAISIITNLLATPYIDPYRPQLILCPDASGNSQLLPQAPVILKISIEGEIGTKKLNAESIIQALNKSRQVIKAERIKGILLCINSPGGSALDSADIYQAILDYKKNYNIPVVSFVNGLCASGGMYVACASDQILATRGSIIGSVGVRLGPCFNYKGLMEKYGVDAKMFTAGKGKAELNPFGTWSANEGDELNAIIQDGYDEFLSVVSSARPRLSRDDLVNKYGAHVFAAPQALNYGYIDDATSSYSRALNLLTKTAAIDSKTAYQVLEIVPYSTLLDGLVDSQINFITRVFGKIIPEIETKNPFYDKVLYLMDH